MFYFLLKYLAFPLINFIWVDKIEGLDNIPKKGGVILAANHSSYFDFITLYAVSPRRLYFLAAEVFFRKKKWRWLMKLTDQIEVDRNAKDKSSSVSMVINYLKQNRVIGIFPEGTRSSDGNLQKAFNGAVKMAITSGAPIVPVGILGTYNIMSRFDKKPKLNKCQLNFGYKIEYPSSFINRIEDKVFIDNLTKDLMIHIARLCNKNYNY